MKKNRKPESFLQKPIYPGGIQAMKAFIQRHLRYPEAARIDKVNGTVRLRMNINHQGKVTSTKIISSLGYGCDEEADRVVRLLQFEVPKQRKLRPKFHKTINIHFRYKEEQKPSPPLQPKQVKTSTQLSYTISKEKPDSEEVQDDSKKSNGGYSYTIKF